MWDATDYDTDDETTARDNLQFVLGFLAKYPELRTRDLYISGESYAGFYVPMLVKQIHDYNQAHANAPIALKGYLIGNGVASWVCLDLCCFGFRSGQGRGTAVWWRPGTR